MGCSHYHKWLQSSVPTPAPGSRSCQAYSDNRHGKGCSIGQGAGSAPTEVRHRSRQPRTNREGLLLNVFSGPEEDRRLTPDIGSQGAERVLESAPLQDAYDFGCPEVGLTRRVVHLHRPQRRVLPCTNCAEAPPISTLCVQGLPLAIQSTPVRPISLSESIHQVCHRRTGVPTCNGSKDSPLPRRLVALLEVPNRSVTRGLASLGTRCITRPTREFGQKRLTTTSNHRFYRHNIELCDNACQTDIATSRRHSPPHAEVPARFQTPTRGVYALARQADLNIDGRPFGTAKAETRTTLDQRTRPSRLQRPYETSRCRPQLDDSHGSMEEPLVPAGRSPHGSGSLPSRDSDNRRQPDRLGGDLAAKGGQRPVGRHRPGRTHQCVGTTSRTPSPVPATATYKGPTRADSHRQHHGGVLHQPSGGSPLGTTATSGTQTLGLGSLSPSQSPSNVPAGYRERSSRLPVSTQTSFRGVATTPTSGPADLGKIRPSVSGPLRDQGECSVSQMVHSKPGCPVPGVARGPPICLSTTPTDMAHTSAGPAGETQSDTGSTGVGDASMVSPAAGTSSGGTLAAPTEERPAAAAGGADLAPESTPPETHGLAGGTKPIGLEDYSTEVQETIMAARAPATRLMYSNRWKLFSRWCAKRGHCPRTCPISAVLSFLQSLLEAGRTPATLKVYTAALSLYHEPVDGFTVGAHKSTALFLRGAKRLCPKRSHPVARWDIHVVLDSLCRPPYEPMGSANLKWITMKTAFLMAITSAKRVGELHALSVSPDCMNWSPDGTAVQLRPNVSFLPKVLPQSYVNAPVTFAEFRPTPGESAAKAELCPVRAIKIYIAATQGIRQCQQLFICYGSDKRGQPVSKQRLSHWITDVIQEAYTRTGRQLPSGVRAHSTRAVATSWAALRGVPLEDICAAANWTSPGTFTRFYRVNIVDTPPLSAAIQSA